MAGELGVLNSTRVSELLDARSRITLHSGNVASWSKVRKKAILVTADEIVSALEGTIKSWMGRQGSAEEWEGGGDVLVCNTGLTKKVGKEERENYLFTVKVFLTSWNGQLVKAAVEKTLVELGISSIQLLIVAFPPCTEEELTLDNMKTVWQYMEELARAGVSSSLGTAELDYAHFKQLYEWASVKPKINQVNLAYCCTMPEDLVRYAKEVDVTLYTHNDEKEVLPLSRLQEALGKSFGRDCSAWKHSWVTRYSSVIRMRGIVAHKGYLLGLQKQ